MRTNRPSQQRFLCLLGFTAALVSGWGSNLSAQEVQFRQQASLYLPTQISLQNGLLHVRQKFGVTLGARLTLTFNERFAVVTGVSYMPGYVTVHGAGKQIDFATRSHQLSATTGARYWLRTPARALSWEVHVGLGAGFGGQPAYEDLFESSTVTAILGTTLRYQIARIVSLQMRIQDRLYRVRFGSGDAGSSKSPLRVSFGLGLPFLRLAP